MKDCGFNFDTTYTRLPKDFFTKLKPDPAPSPQLIILNHTLAKSLGLKLNHLSSQQLAEIFSGNCLPEGATPFAQAYAGHQFGYFTMLGDGRAHMFGEHITQHGNRVDLQFKGSGPTPFARRGDGKAALGPMLREFIISEAMHHLEIPTTRSLAVVTTGEPIRRETFLPGAVLTRVALSHIRVGTFEYAAIKQKIEALINYTLERHDPELVKSNKKALAFLETVMIRQIDLIVHWMRVGFIHGVMNTDNMTISGKPLTMGPAPLWILMILIRFLVLSISKGATLLLTRLI